MLGFRAYLVLAWQRAGYLLAYLGACNRKRLEHYIGRRDSDSQLTNDLRQVHN